MAPPSSFRPRATPATDPNPPRGAAPTPTHRRAWLRHLPGWAALAWGLAGAPVPTAAAATPAPGPRRRDVLRHHAVLVLAAYEDTLAAAKDLQAAIERFLAAPDEPGLERARAAWREAREWYGRTEAFRFWGGPIDGAGGPEPRLNGWPLDESYVDAVVGAPSAGLVNDRRVPLTRATLIALNERGGEENIATGWHAIEFMLWGQDLDDDGPGRRPASDFVDGGAANADRRRRYLSLITALLVDDLAGLVAAWRGPWARRFADGGLRSLRGLFTGLGVLSRGELAGERLEVALHTKDQEDEQSCFSDNTHRDAVANAHGIRQVWQGRCRRRDGRLLDGPGPRDLLATRDAALAAQVDALIAASVAAVEALQPPFDREMRGGDDAPGRRRIRHAIDCLSRQAQGLADAAAALGITRLSVTLP